MNKKVEKLMRNSRFISAKQSEDGLAWKVTMTSLRYKDKWVDVNGDYVPNDNYDVYIYKGDRGKSVVTDPRIDYLKPSDFNTGLPHCYIVDIDGTVALINGRNPYDGTKVHTDMLNEPVTKLLVNFIKSNPNAVIIYSTGRDERFRDITEKWLNDNNIWYNHLLMRPENEKKPDFEVKKDNYYNYIYGKYNVELVIEDRGRVVRMYRDELKLPTIVPWYDNF